MSRGLRPSKAQLLLLAKIECGRPPGTPGEHQTLTALRAWSLVDDQHLALTVAGARLLDKWRYACWACSTTKGKLLRCRVGGTWMWACAAHAPPSSKGKTRIEVLGKKLRLTFSSVDALRLARAMEAGAPLSVAIGKLVHAGAGVRIEMDLGCVAAEGAAVAWRALDEGAAAAPAAPGGRDHG